MLCMSTELTWQTTSTGSEDTWRLGEALGSKLAGGETIELVGDLGGGKTIFTQGLAKGLGSQDNVSSPTFTLNKVYKAKNDLQIHHFDFYRLTEAGVMRAQMHESVNNPQVVVVVEWSRIVRDVLPTDRISIKLEPTAGDPDERLITVNYPEKFAEAIKAVQAEREEVEP